MNSSTTASLPYAVAIVIRLRYSSGGGVEPLDECATVAATRARLPLVIELIAAANKYGSC